jgi:hypothetical protein
MHVCLVHVPVRTPRQPWAFHTVLMGSSLAAGSWARVSPDRRALAGWALLPLARSLAWALTRAYRQLPAPSVWPSIGWRVLSVPTRRKLYTLSRGPMVRKKQSREQLCYLPTA